MANQAGRLSLTFFAAAISLQGSTKNNGNSTGLKPWGSFGLEREKFTAALSCAGFQHPHLIVSVGAVTAMLGVALNLILGLSRVVLAMGLTCRACSRKWTVPVPRPYPQRLQCIRRGRQET